MDGLNNDGASMKTVDCVDFTKYLITGKIPPLFDDIAIIYDLDIEKKQEYRDKKYSPGYNYSYRVVDGF